MYNYDPWFLRYNTRHNGTLYNMKKNSQVQLESHLKMTTEIQFKIYFFFFLKRVENIVTKGENACSMHFPLFLKSQ